MEPQAAISNRFPCSRYQPEVPHSDCKDCDCDGGGDGDNDGDGDGDEVDVDTNGYGLPRMHLQTPPPTTSLSKVGLGSSATLPPPPLPLPVLPTSGHPGQIAVFPAQVCPPSYSLAKKQGKKLICLKY